MIGATVEITSERPLQAWNGERDMNVIGRSECTGTAAREAADLIAVEAPSADAVAEAHGVIEAADEWAAHDVELDRRRAAERYDSAPQRRSEVFPFFPAPTPERIAARAEFEALGAAIAKFDSERYASLSDDERALDA